MDEGIITEVIMIMVVLVVGFTLVVTLTPFLRSFSVPQAAPLAEFVYTYAEYNSTYKWYGYLYVYDNNPVDLYSITLFSSGELTISKIIITYPDNTQKNFTAGSNLNLRLGKGLYNITIVFTAPPSITKVGYTVSLTGGHTLSGETVIRRQ